MLLFHEKTKKAVSIGFMVVGALVIISMILLYFPVWR
jgi:predicted nucleic acid-binding Zn ribbon protein